MRLSSKALREPNTEYSRFVWIQFILRLRIDYSCFTPFSVLTLEFPSVGFDSVSILYNDAIAQSKTQRHNDTTITLSMEALAQSIRMKYSLLNAFHAMFYYS